MTLSKQLACLVTGLFLASASFSTVAESASGSVLATVNGGKIYTSQVNEVVSMAVASGAKDDPELRQTVLNDLIVRELISQDIKKTGFLNKDNNALKLKLAQQNAMLELWYGEYFKVHPVTEVDVRVEYDRQVALSKEPKNAKQYEVSQIQVATQAEGEQIIRQINDGAKFDVLAKEKSMDRLTGAQGGLVGWIFVDQLAAPIANVIVNLAKGSVAQTPVQTPNGWHIIKVDGVRSFVMPEFDKVKNNITQELVQQRRQQAINELLKEAKVSK